MGSSSLWTLKKLNLKSRSSQSLYSQNLFLWPEAALSEVFGRYCPPLSALGDHSSQQNLDQANLLKPLHIPVPDIVHPGFAKG